MHDIPYMPAKKIGPEIVSSMTRVCIAVRQLVPEHIPCGLQVGWSYNSYTAFTDLSIMTLDIGCCQ